MRRIRSAGKRAPRVAGRAAVGAARDAVGEPVLRRDVAARGALPVERGRVGGGVLRWMSDSRSRAHCTRGAGCRWSPRCEDSAWRYGRGCRWPCACGCSWVESSVAVRMLVDEVDLEQQLALGEHVRRAGRRRTMRCSSESTIMRSARLLGGGEVVRGDDDGAAGGASTPRARRAARPGCAGRARWSARPSAAPAAPS